MKESFTREGVEVFHLLFLEKLGKLIDQSFYAVKGGCNMRFFLLSPRFSEDLEIDIKTIHKETLQKKVEQLLSGNSFSLSLKARNISIHEITAPKQTATAQRWKIKIQLPNGEFAHTKIEFSRLGMSNGTRLDTMRQELLLRYQIPPFIANHYTKEAAFEQKLLALVNRPVTQARDIFDIQHLLKTGLNYPQAMIPDKEKCINAIMSVSYGDYMSLVVAYLPLEDQKNYGSKEIWEGMQLEIIGILER